QDLALIKIDVKNEINSQGQIKTRDFPVLTLGDSSKIKIGQTAIAIGNALGEFSNTVSVGIISGKGRTITAQGAGIAETLEDILQTDAAINRGNSGGPLLNLKGEVIGINVAVAEDAQGIGFAVPINEAKINIKQYQEQGKISRAFLGVRYLEINKAKQSERALVVDYGALIIRGENINEPAITPGSAADKAGLKEGDIILEVSGEKITENNSLSKIIRQYYPNQTITLKIMRNGSILTLPVVLGDRTE
ncbi:trypsin-like peptidase domain-containing protein, partial [Candidatus Gribaldobacteria bacterium]|nr:trypsin-like peptidase domain-containing protein [Candidatus Gribaldobacteria bacterium]